MSKGDVQRYKLQAKRIVTTSVLVTTSKALVTSSDALLPSSLLCFLKKIQPTNCPGFNNLTNASRKAPSWHTAV